MELLSYCNNNWIFFVYKKEKIPKKRNIKNPIIHQVIMSILNSGSVGSVFKKTKS